MSNGFPAMLRNDKIQYKMSRFYYICCWLLMDISSYGGSLEFLQMETSAIDGILYEAK